MSKIFIGDACAYIPAKGTQKAKYPKIGAAFRDDKDDRISLKIDSIPIATSGWEGWLNVFPPKTSTATRPKMPGDDKPYGTVMGDGLEDDIPF